MISSHLTGDEPAYHRRVVITPAQNASSAWVEDDYHHMGVVLRHDGHTITGVDPFMIRVPWTTCPGAVQQLQATFTGVALSDAVRRGEKSINCTHLHDMALLAAAHADDTLPTRYQLIVTDAVDGVRIAEVERDGAPVLWIVERDKLVEEPVAAAGNTLFQLGDWIATLDREGQEAARLLRWGAIVAHGRARPIEEQSDARLMPPSCYTFQDGRKEVAFRVGEIVDFSAKDGQPHKLA